MSAKRSDDKDEGRPALPESVCLPREFFSDSRDTFRNFATAWVVTRYHQLVNGGGDEYFRTVAGEEISSLSRQIDEKWPLDRSEFGKMAGLKSNNPLALFLAAQAVSSVDSIEPVAAEVGVRGRYQETMAVYLERVLMMSPSYLNHGNVTLASTEGGHYYCLPDPFDDSHQKLLRIGQAQAAGLQDPPVNPDMNMVRRVVFSELLSSQGVVDNLPKIASLVRGLTAVPNHLYQLDLLGSLFQLKVGQFTNAFNAQTGSSFPRPIVDEASLFVAVTQACPHDFISPVLPSYAFELRPDLRDDLRQGYLAVIRSKSMVNGSGFFDQHGFTQAQAAYQFIRQLNSSVGSMGVADVQLVNSLFILPSKDIEGMRLELEQLREQERQLTQQLEANKTRQAIIMGSIR